MHGCLLVAIVGSNTDTAGILVVVAYPAGWIMLGDKTEKLHKTFTETVSYFNKGPLNDFTFEIVILFIYIYCVCCSAKRWNTHDKDWNSDFRGIDLMTQFLSGGVESIYYRF